MLKMLHKEVVELYCIKKEEKTRFKKQRSILSMLLIVSIIAGQFFITSGISAKEVTSAGITASATADATSKSKFTPAEGWENYNYFNFAEALQKSIYF